MCGIRKIFGGGTKDSYDYTIWGENSELDV